MNVVRFRLPMLIPLLAAFAPVVRADEGDSPWKMEVFGGDTIGMRGSLTRPMSVELPDAGAISPALAGQSAAIGFDRMKFDDIFHPKYSAGTELSYTFSPEVQTYGRFNYDSYSGHTRTVGELTSENGAPSPVRANFGDLDTWSLELGSRYFIPTGLSFQPFAGAALGMTRVHSITASFDAPNDALALPSAAFTRSENRFSQSVETGIDMQTIPNLDLRLSVQADHIAAPHEAHDADLADLGLNTQHAGDQWNFPVTVGAIYRF
jgi:hypothetical protein